MQLQPLHRQHLTLWGLFCSVHKVLRVFYSPNHELKGQRAAGIPTMALGASIDTTATPAQLHLLSLSLSFAHYLAYLDIQNSARVLAPSLKKATHSSHHSAIHLTRTKTPGIPLGNAILILALCSIRSDPSSQNVCSEPCLKQKLLRLVIILLVCDTFTRIAFWGEVVCYFRANT